MIGAWMFMAMFVGEAAGRDRIVVSLGSSSGPEGVAAEWFVEGCNVRVRLSNERAEPIELDWTRSTFSPQGQAATPLVPGSSSKLSAMINILPMVVPPGGFTEEIIFRKDRLPSDSDGCLVDPGTEASIMLAISGEWLTQAMAFKEDARRCQRREPADAEAFRAYTTMDVRVGQVCLDGPDVAEVCIDATGDQQACAWVLIEDRMTVLGCEDLAPQAASTIRKWKKSRMVGNWTVPWFYSTPVGLGYYRLLPLTQDRGIRLGSAA